MKKGKFDMKSNLRNIYVGYHMWFSEGSVSVKDDNTKCRLRDMDRVVRLHLHFLPV